MPYQFIYTPVVNYYYISVKLLSRPLYRDRLNKGTAMFIRWALFNKTLVLVLNLTISRYNSTDGVPQQVFKYFFLCQSTPAMQLVPISQRSLIDHGFLSIYMLRPIQPYKFFGSWHDKPSFHNFTKIWLHHGFFLENFAKFSEHFFLYTCTVTIGHTRWVKLKNFIIGYHR